MRAEFLPSVVVAREIGRGLKEIGAGLTVESRDTNAIHHSQVRILYEIRRIFPRRCKAPDMAQERTAVLIEQKREKCPLCRVRGVGGFAFRFRVRRF
jgi:RNase P subunit RPR2